MIYQYIYMSFRSENEMDFKKHRWMQGSIQIITYQADDCVCMVSINLS